MFMNISISISYEENEEQFVLSRTLDMTYELRIHQASFYYGVDRGERRNLRTYETFARSSEEYFMAQKCVCFLYPAVKALGKAAAKVRNFRKGTFHDGGNEKYANLLSRKTF